MAFLNLFLGFLTRALGAGYPYLLLAVGGFYASLWVLILGTFFANTWMLNEILRVRIILLAGSDHFSVWTPREVLLARVAIGFYWFLLLNAAGSIGYCWLLTHVRAKRYQMPSGSIAPPPRTVMQTTFSTSLRFDFAGLGMDGNRPNRCAEECVNAGAWKGDRMYHCRHGYNRCLPVFDHYCFWLRVPVYLDTIKPYCLFMPLMFLYLAFCLGIMLWAMVSPHMRGLSRWSFAVAALSFLIGGFTAFDMMKWQWGQIIFKNLVGKERRHNWRWTMAIRKFDGTLMADEPDFNPYSLGTPWANAQEVLGRWYQMPFWFWQPERVGQYGHHLNLDNDTTISPAYMMHVSLRRREMALEDDLFGLPLLPPPPPPPGFPRRRHNASDLV